MGHSRSMQLLSAEVLPGASWCFLVFFTFNLNLSYWPRKLCTWGFLFVLFFWTGSASSALVSGITHLILDAFKYEMKFHQSWHRLVPGAYLETCCNAESFVPQCTSKTVETPPPHDTHTPPTICQCFFPFIVFSNVIFCCHIKPVHYYCFFVIVLVHPNSLKLASQTLTQCKCK